VTCKVFKMTHSVSFSRELFVSVGDFVPMETSASQVLVMIELEDSSVWVSGTLLTFSIEDICMSWLSSLCLFCQAASSEISQVHTVHIHQCHDFRLSPSRSLLCHTGHMEEFYFIIIFSTGIPQLDGNRHGWLTVVFMKHLQFYVLSDASTFVAITYTYSLLINATLFKFILFLNHLS
jgi:hypothetical protein